MMQAIPSNDIAVLGCGNMGAALARQFAASGKSVVVWNRSPARAMALRGPNIAVAATAQSAVDAVDLVVAVLTNYDVVCEVLDPLVGLRGKAFVNLTTGGPEAVTAPNNLCEQKGARYLDGAIFAYPHQIGQADCAVFYSGPDDVWNQHGSTLRLLGGNSQHIAQSLGAANVLDTGIVGAFYLSSVTAFLESAAFMLGAGISPEVMLHATKPILDVLSESVSEAVDAIKSGSFDTDQATLAIIAESMRNFDEAMCASGHPSRLLSATSALADEAEAAGHGEASYYSMIKTLMSADAAL